MNQTPLEFSESLVKGKIVETVFFRLFSHSNNFVVLPFGYENVLPALAGINSNGDDDDAISAIKRAPDFVLIDREEPHDVRLVEVKYLMNPSRETVLKKARLILKSWRPSYLFLATPTGFFMGRVSDIVKNDGAMLPLSEDIISHDLQDEYVDLVNKYIRHN